jgi:hypothetical protein
VNQLVTNASKEQLAESATILAVQVAHYASRYGPLAMEERLSFLHVTDLTEERANLIIHGLDTFLDVLSNTLEHQRPIH